MDQTNKHDVAEHIEEATERYWLQGLDVNYSKRHAFVEHTREQARMELHTGPIIEFR